MNKMNKKGFTLIEMLVVIAIIAILVSIVVPTVSAATEKAKEARDAANIRSKIAEVTAEGLSTNADVTDTVKLTQDGAFDKNPDLVEAGNIAGYPLSTFTDKTTVTISYEADTGEVSVTAE